MSQSAVARPNLMVVWLRAARVPFLTGAAVPVLLGSLVAWYETGLFSGSLFTLTLVGAVLAQAGANMANDFYDYRSDNDRINRFRSQFNGGSGVILDRWLTPGQTHLWALLSLTLAAAIGVYLWSLRGPGVLVLMLLGGLFGYFYTGEPVRLAHRGVGEIAIGLSFGPLLVAGAYLVQAGAVSPGAIVASVPIGLLITAVLYINQFPDYEADRAVGKAHWVVRLGLERAIPGLAALLFGTYLWIAGTVVAGLAPWPTLLALLAAPLVVRAVDLTRRHYHSPIQLRPANAMVIGAHLITGLLLSIAFVVSRLLGV